MKRQSIDRISDLPDEILYYILLHIESPREVAQTIVLSRRWRRLLCSYPMVKFDISEWNDLCIDPASRFLKFHNWTIQRFSRESSLLMETLKLKLTLSVRKARVEMLANLLNLASERKAEEVEIACCNPMNLPFNSLSNPVVKILKLKSLAFAAYNRYSDDPPVSLNSLRFLHLDRVYFDGDWLLANMIASAPLLETLELRSIVSLRKLKVSTRLTKLRRLEIADCDYLEEVEMTALRLQALHLGGTRSLSKLELTAPQLYLLTISDSRWMACHLEAAISKLPSLRWLILTELYLEGEKKLRLSSPRLEEFNLLAPRLEEIELNAGPHLRRFLMRFHKGCFLDELNKCEINPACRWEVSCSDFLLSDNRKRVALESLLARFTNFSMVSSG